MSMNALDLETAIMGLSVADRLALAGRILQSVPDDVDHDIEELWLLEAERRWKSYLAGTTTASGAEEVFARIEARGT